MDERTTMNMDPTRHRRSRLGLIALMLVAIVLGFGATADQSGPSSDAKDKPIKTGPQSRWNVKYQIQGRQIVVHAEEGGRLVVELEGKTLPEECIRQEDGKLILLDEEGQELQVLHLFRPLNRDFMIRMLDDPRGGALALTLERDDAPELGWVNEAPGFDFEFSPPKVMLGILTEATSETLEKHLHLDVSATVTITGLYEDLPAQQAGIEVHDIILGVDGVRPVSQQVLLEAMNRKNPGDELTLDVIQAGERKAFTVSLEAFDLQRMRSATLLGSAPYQSWTRHRHDHELRARRFRSNLEGVLVTPDSSNLFRFGLDQIDHDIQSEIRVLLQEFKSQDGANDREIVEMELRLNELKEELQSLRRNDEIRKGGAPE